MGPTPEFAIEVPPGTAVCGVYKLDRSLDQEEAVLSYAQLAGGTHILRTDRTQFDGALIERLWIGGPNREAVALEPGRFSLAVQRDGAGQARYDYTFRQPFSVEGQRYDVEIARLRFGAGGAAGRIVFDEQYLGSIAATEGLLPGLAMTARTDPPSYLSEVVFGSVTYAVLPLFQVETGTADIAITLRYRRLTLLGAYGPANLTHARVVIHGEERVVDAYWHLVYRARMHNTQQHFRVRLAPPAGDVHAVDVLEPFEDVLPPRIVLRGAGMEILDAFEPPGYVETPLHDPAPVAFVRGDADGNGFTNISDAVLVIRYVVGADPPAPCVKALDVNDDGAVGIDDAVHLLGHLFLGTGPLAPPAAACGYDPTPDDLPCAVYPRCGN